MNHVLHKYEQQKYVELTTMQMTLSDAEGYPKSALHHQQNCKQEHEVTQY